jgi:hypothetical protein
VPIKNKITTKRFRIRSKKFFLTYPQVPDVENIEEQFIKAFENIFGTNNMKYFLCKEKHKDGNPHIHVYLEFNTRQEIPSRERLHVKIVLNGQIKLCEGRYEAVRNSEKTLDYISKDCGNNYKSNMDVPLIGSNFY